MRLAVLALCLAPCIGLADSFPLRSDVSEVTIYPQGAKITRTVPFSIPAGVHDLILPDLPDSTPLEYVRVFVDGARMGAMTLRSDYVPPRDEVKTAELAEAEANIKAIEAQIQGKQDEVAHIRLTATAAKSRLRFLDHLGEGDDMMAAGVDTLRQLSNMIGEEALVAQQVALTAEIEARNTEMALEDLRETLAKAQQGLSALVPEVQERAFLSVAVDADAETQGVLTVSYFIKDAAWGPVYDMYLTRGSSASVDILRGGFVTQWTGENWTDVSLILSTVQPSDQIEPSQLFTQRRRVEDPAPALPKRSFENLAEPVVEAPVIIDETSYARFDGPAVVYVYPTPVSIASGADAVRLKLGELTTGADVQARAVPMRDDTAFLVAEIINDTEEEILPSEFVSLFVDDTFVGTTSTEGVPIGAQADLPFGPIDGLRLKRLVLNQNQGDRGLLTKSNERTQSAQIEVKNLSKDTWSLRVLDRVPYSEQDDLNIAWSALPQADEIDVDGRRGILAWDLTLEPGDVQTIRINQSLSWPDGKILR